MNQSQPKQFRVLNRDGTFNISRQGLRKVWVSDLYHSLLAVSWAQLLGLVFLLYIAINLFFATGYVMCGEHALVGLEDSQISSRFLNAFFFSVQTLATIGYGRITPAGIAANVLVTIESVIGLLSLALVTGIIFSRFSRPTARVIFSNVAVVSAHQGTPALMFRIANARQNQIVQAKIDVVLTKDERTSEGKEFRTFTDLKLVRNFSPIFALTWTVFHHIDESSPLYGMNADHLKQCNAEFIVLLTGVDDTFSQTIHTRFSYKPDEIIWGKNFKDILSWCAEGLRVVDLARIHDVE